MNPLPSSGGDTTGSLGCSWAAVARGWSGSCVTASAVVSQVTFTPRLGACVRHPSRGVGERCRGGSGALTCWKMLCKRTGFYHRVGLNDCKCVTLARAPLCHCQMWGASTLGTRISWLGAKGVSWWEGMCCTGVEEQHGADMVREIPAVHVHSDAPGYQWKTISEEQINTQIIIPQVNMRNISGAEAQLGSWKSSSKAQELVVKAGSNYFI